VHAYQFLKAQDEKHVFARIKHMMCDAVLKQKVASKSSQYWKFMLVLHSVKLLCYHVYCTLVQWNRCCTCWQNENCLFVLCLLFLDKRCNSSCYSLCHLARVCIDFYFCHVALRFAFVCCAKKMYAQEFAKKFAKYKNRLYGKHWRMSSGCLQMSMWTSSVRKIKALCVRKFFIN